MNAASIKNDQNLILLQSQIKSLNSKLVEKDNEIHKKTKDIATRDVKNSELELAVTKSASIKNLIQGNDFENIVAIFLKKITFFRHLRERKFAQFCYFNYKYIRLGRSS